MSAAFQSVGQLSPLPREALDIAAAGVPARVAKTRGYRGELILFTADENMAGWGFHFVNQLRRRGHEHWLIMADSADNCAGMHAQWEKMVSSYSEAPLSCAYSSYPKQHSGWAQWTRANHPDKMHQVYIFWATRWWVSLKLMREGLNILSLDVDAVLLGDIYSRLHSPPMVHQDVIITRNDDGSQSLNCGFVYFNRGASRARREQPSTYLTATSTEVDSHCGERARPESAADVPTAEWVCELMWERLRLFLEVDRVALRDSPKREVLWEQDAWNDLVKSLELRRRVFPWATGYGRQSDLWAALGYNRVVVGGRKHAEKFVAWRKLKHERSPPFGAPDEPPYARRFFESSLETPLLWLPLCSPPNSSSAASAAVGKGEKDGIPLGLLLPRPAAPGRMLVAPSWLASLGNDPESEWAGVPEAAGNPLTYVHITNMWKCFPHPCWSKAGRLFWLRAHGFWDSRLDKLGLTPRGSPFTAKTRALALPEADIAALSALAEQTKQLAAWPAPRARGLGFRRLHAIVHNLVTAAALLGRVPVIPQVPCELIRAVQSLANHNTERSRFGISHAAVVVTGADPAAPVCHLAPGTWRPGGPDQCYHTAAMGQFDLPRFVGSLRGAPNGTLALRLAPALRSGEAPTSLSWGRATAELELAPIRDLCGAAARLADVPLVHLSGLMPPNGAEEVPLLDVPLPSREFRSERQRRENGAPRWPSLLKGSNLKELANACPGAGNLIDYRKQCVGFFLAE